MYLYLMRHGEAFSKEENATRDLNERGKVEVSKIATHLKNINISCDKIYHSEIPRAIQTAQLVAEKLGVLQKMTVLPSLNADEDIYNVIVDIEELTETSFLVGHLPNLELLSNYLLTGNISKSTVGFATATVVCLEKKEDKWLLKWHIDPASIKN